MKNFMWLFLATVLLFSCNDELKVNADFKDVSIIYGILDKSKDTNYVRIHRGYLGNQGVTGGNQNPDSLYYPELTVVVQELENGNVKKTIPLTKDTSIKLDSGFFTTKDYHTYRLDYTLNADYVYKLVVDKENDNLNEVYATTPVVGDFSFIKPQNNPNVKLSYAPRGQDLEWHYAREGRMYQPVIRFYYTEINLNNFNDSVEKYVDYKIPSRTANNLTGDGKFETTIEYEDYYTYLYNQIGVNPNVIRFYRGSDYKVVAAADDFATYMNVNAPSNSIIQDKPQFTNLYGGTDANAGIFSTTNVLIRENLDLSTASYSELQSGDITCDLQFAYLSILDTCYCSNGKQICL